MKLLVIVALIAVAVVAYRRVVKKSGPQYMGCYVDKQRPDRAMPNFLGYPMGSADAFKEGKARKQMYVGLQAGGMADGDNLDLTQVWGSVDDSYKRHGAYEEGKFPGTTPCKKVPGTGLMVGGDYTNAVYQIL